MRNGMGMRGISFGMRGSSWMEMQEIPGIRAGIHHGILGIRVEMQAIRIAGEKGGFSSRNHIERSQNNRKENICKN